MYKIEQFFKAEVVFEASVEVDDYSYLIIYGKHINGYYCCVPGWNWGCEMAEPSSIPFNQSKLMKCGVEEQIARALAEAINSICINSAKIN